MAKKVTYSEPVDYIPKSVRKELGLGEFNTAESNNKAGSKSASKTTKAKKK